MFTPFLQAIALERAKVVIPGQMLQTGRQLGVPEAIRLSERLGFSGPFAKSEDLYRGIIAASPIELVNAASALVSHGTQYEPHLIAVISNMDGQVLYESSVKVSQVVSKDTASDALEMMELENGMFYTPTASRHDAWGLSINDDHVTALWLGYDQSKVIAAESALKKSLAATLKKLD